MPIKLKSDLLNMLAVSTVISSGSASFPIEIPAWGYPQINGVPTLTLTATTFAGNPDTNYAPLAIFSEIECTGYAGEELSTAVRDLSRSEVAYTHHYGDEGAVYTLPERIGGGGRSRNISYTQDAVHDYRKPGKYLHRVFAYDRAGNWGVFEETITVKEDDFTPSETVVIDPTGTFLGCPLAAGTNRFTSWDDFATGYTPSGASRLKIWLRRGHEYLYSETLTNKPPLLIMEGFGPKADADPVLQPTALIAPISFVKGGTVKVMGVTLNGPYNASSELYNGNGLTGNELIGDADTGISWIDNASDGVNVEITLVNAHAIGCDGVLYAGTNSEGSVGHFCVSECRNTNNRNFYSLTGGTGLRMAILGSSNVQNPLASNGRTSREEFYPTRYTGNTHGGDRLGNFYWYHKECCDLFVRTGWSLQGDIFADNPAERIMTNGGHTGKAYITRCHVEGTVTSAAATGSITMLPVLLYFAMNRVFGDPTNKTLFKMSAAGSIVENNFFLNPNRAGRNMDAILHFGDQDEASSADYQTIVRNNTIINLNVGRAANFHVVRKWSFSANNVIEENNVIYDVGGDTSDGPFDMTSLGFESRYLGTKANEIAWNDVGTIQEDVPPEGSILIPYGLDYRGNQTDASTFSTVAPYIKAVIGGVSHTGASIAAMNGWAVIEVAFEAGGVRIINKSANTWAAGANIGRVFLWRHEDHPLPMDTTFTFDTGAFITWALTPVSGAYQSATGVVSLMDFDGQPRPGSGHKDAPAGSPSKGALEAV